MSSRNNKNTNDNTPYLFDMDELFHGENKLPLFVRFNFFSMKVVFIVGVVFFGFLGFLVNLFS